MAKAETISSRFVYTRLLAVFTAVFAVLVRTTGEIALIASDIIDALPRCWQNLEALSRPKDGKMYYLCSENI